MKESDKIKLAVDKDYHVVTVNYSLHMIEDKFNKFIAEMKNQEIKLNERNKHAKQQTD